MFPGPEAEKAPKRASLASPLEAGKALLGSLVQASQQLFSSLSGKKKRAAEEAAPGEEAGPGEGGAPAAKRAKATGHPESWPEAELIRDHFFIDVTQPATQNLFTLEESVNW